MQHGDDGAALLAAEREEVDADSSGASGFPVSIENKFGTTTIDSEPKRIVTVGLVEQDALLALGIVPVGSGSPEPTGRFSRRGPR